MEPWHGKLDERESQLAEQLEREVFGAEDHIARR